MDLKKCIMLALSAKQLHLQLLTVGPGFCMVVSSRHLTCPPNSSDPIIIKEGGFIVVADWSIVTVVRLMTYRSCMISIYFFLCTSINDRTSHLKAENCHH